MLTLLLALTHTISFSLIGHPQVYRFCVCKEPAVKFSVVITSGFLYVGIVLVPCTRSVYGFVHFLWLPEKKSSGSGTGFTQPREYN
jgi:hypothetical protein